ncbi:MAG: spore germination protein [Roseburia sp.]|nr:spore germination protein [Roseburia sp.]MCM1098745.1 spore germination protein [Ruminococcus flavefaciens]
MPLSATLDENIEYLKSSLPIGSSFDLMTRDLLLGDTRAYFLGINGFCKTEVLQQIFSDLQNPLYMTDGKVEDLERYVRARMGYAQVSLSDSWEDIIRNLLSGPSVLLIDGFNRAVLIDVRSYPARSVAEPDLEKVTRGSRDGFVETLLLNANLIRRRVRSPKLCFSMHSVGTESRTDVAVAYLEGSVNRGLLDTVSRTIDSLRVSALTMGAKSLEELLLPKRWWTPLPSIQVTERPDVACSYLLEGHILLLVDNSPVVLILPCTIFQFTQSPEDYYNSPSVGSYFRLIRFLCVPVSLLLMPVFLLLTAWFPEISARWELLSTEDLTPERIFFYVLAVEFILDLFKYSSSLSSGKFSGSLSVVGGLIIGDIAVSLNWLSVEVLFYGAVTLLASLSISGKEFSDALRLYRILLVLAVGFFGLPGFLIGLGLVLLSAAATPTFGGFSYFWPLFPFNKKALGRLLFRSPTPKAQPSQVWRRGSVKNRGRE